jgi:co-chaperonin GroES (HSP10)
MEDKKINNKIKELGEEFDEIIAGNKKNTQKPDRRPLYSNDMEFEDFDILISPGPRVVIEIERFSETTASGIRLPSELIRREQDKVTKGIFRKCGSTAFNQMCSNEEMPMNGDTVAFVKWAGFEIKIKDKYYRIVNDEDIWLIQRGKN